MSKVWKSFDSKELKFLAEKGTFRIERDLELMRSSKRMRIVK
jgi:hypothetical protein